MLVIVGHAVNLLEEYRRGVNGSSRSWKVGRSLRDRGGTRQLKERDKVIAERIEELELMEVWYEDDPTMRLKINFPFFLGTGNKNTAVVYFEIEPGHRLGTHTDSAEEILLVLNGTVEVSLGDEQGQVSTGEMAVVPAMVPQGVRNVGDETARFV